MLREQLSAGGGTPAAAAGNSAAWPGNGEAMQRAGSAAALAWMPPLEGGEAKGAAAVVPAAYKASASVVSWFPMYQPRLEVRRRLPCAPACIRPCPPAGGRVRRDVRRRGEEKRARWRGGEARVEEGRRSAGERAQKR